MAWDIKSAADYEATIRRIQAKMDNIAKDVPRNAIRALNDIVLDGLERSVMKAPVREGDLRGSGFAEVNRATVAMGNEDGSIEIIGAPGESSGNEAEAAFGFTAPYSFVQHEHTEFVHPKGGEAKFVESTVVEREQAWKKHIADEARKGFRGGG